MTFIITTKRYSDRDQYVATCDDCELTSPSRYSKSGAVSDLYDLHILDGVKHA